MPKITLLVETASDILNGDHDTAEVIKDAIVDTGRWSIHHNLIFKLNGKIYQTTYSVGATEYQDEGPWEGSEEVLCTEVEEYEKTVKAYRVVKD